MNPADEQKIECPVCYRRAMPRLRVVASGILSVCPYCLSPYPPERRGHYAFFTAPDRTGLPSDRDAS
jgi:hypothetical protein